ncbi:lysine exporter protein LysE/YggA [Pseudomonas sp. M47T1]|uniref:LysE family translocator n=1 Tax=Pseudomonas sp. M47T1 TaxID=1179778 RepID=UPI0002607B90|nr:LysE family translocator [Pseudomonas sp. M47T1]EIK94085.1 lysine exporter protein LysE/YggA [Pseudomonas sp. M47T1]
MSLSLSMAAFALASSISPGPVNIVALNAGARHGLPASLWHVTGATAGFTLLLVLTGFGLHELLALWPGLTRAIQWAGVAFLLYLAWRLARDNGALGSAAGSRPPSLLGGAAMQWLNPKAWLACVAGMGAFAADGDSARIWLFAVIYFVVCYLSIACWAWAGSLIRGHLEHPARVRLFNRGLALLLVGCAAYLVAG